MQLNRIDMNLLVYLDVLLRERSVTRAADQLGISQPAMSNGLRRLRVLFDDPLLIRTSEGMTPTERARQLEPTLRTVLQDIERAVQPRSDFDAAASGRVFRIMVSDYAESTLIPPLLRRLREIAPSVILDLMTPSDVSFFDVEQGKVDLVINRFNSIPQSFHQTTVWKDDFCCMVSRDNPILDNFSLKNYLEAQHVWVSKTGFGVSVGVDPGDVQRLGWVDEVLRQLGKKRRITVFTRHYQAAMLLSEQNDLVLTVPSRAALLQAENPRLVVKAPPFEIPPIQLKLVWSPLLHHDPAHRWMRRLINEVAEEVIAPEF
ncbi:LysR family transcriptional regulator [Saccharospirillum sp. MSK14-1]|uniref:LysR family transcriptional regulator n=1 Tax=Saccharospirillum sp. MSK14-1 TaxID=1897632 RepID=UPI000D3BF1C9|nr:LysR family transcriptional regulator [Saccharospirillum sp. MSK14-1]PTY35966.1 LysR family transcriptional regulator [Saccharospirillum sp. MSK14-1]